MKIILSRKGFDDENGGYSSPIMPSGGLVSLPIPNYKDSIRYSDLIARASPKRRFGIVRFLYRRNGFTFMKIMKIVEEGTAEIALHPVRFRILQVIKDAAEPQFVEQIAKAIDEHPRLVSHHLNVLQDIGLVECTYEVAKAKGSTRRGVAVRFCKPTPKLSEVFQDIVKAAKDVAEVK